MYKRDNYVGAVRAAFLLPSRKRAFTILHMIPAWKLANASPAVITALHVPSELPGGSNKKNRAASSAGWRRGRKGLIPRVRLRGIFHARREVDTALPVTVNGEP